MSNSIQHVRASAMQRFKITFGIAAFGGIAGAVAGGLSALLVGSILERSVQVLLDGSFFLFGAAIGAPLGALLLPIAAWTLMRYVSFGRAFVGTVAGTLIGGLAGWFITSDPYDLPRSIVGGVVGFIVAAVVLRLRVRAAGHTALPAEYGDPIEHPPSVPLNPE